MDGENRDQDKKFQICPPKEIRKSPVSLDVLKSAYIAEGLTAEEIAARYFLPIGQVTNIIEENNLPELRKAYIVQGIQKIQNVQLQQSNQLMELELNFKKLRIIQLEKELKDYIAYYERHGDFYKRHHVTGEILKDLSGIPMQIRIPNVAREISQLKESVTMSEGVRHLLNRLDEIMNTGRPVENINEQDNNEIVEADFSTIFESSDD